MLKKSDVLDILAAGGVVKLDLVLTRAYVFAADGSFIDRCRWDVANKLYYSGDYLKGFDGWNRTVRADIAVPALEELPSDISVDECVGEVSVIKIRGLYFVRIETLRGLFYHGDYLTFEGAEAAAKNFVRNRIECAFCYVENERGLDDG